MKSNTIKTVVFVSVLALVFSMFGAMTAEAGNFASNKHGKSSVYTAPGFKSPDLTILPYPPEPPLDKIKPIKPRPPIKVYPIKPPKFKFPIKPPKPGIGVPAPVDPIKYLR